MRISPIRAGTDARFLHDYGERRPLAFRDWCVLKPVRRVACEPLARGPNPWRCAGPWFGPAFCAGFPPEKCPGISTEAILLARAKAGILSRMNSFDWQIVHGHKVSAGDGLGAFLDVTV